MTTERILVMVLNMRSPIPNAAAIKSHSPSKVVLLKVNPSDAAVREYIEESEERLVAWANGTLPEVYGFDSDLNLEHAPAPPSVVPEILVVEVEDLIHSSDRIEGHIAESARSQSYEVRFEICAGRKEDSAQLSRVARVLKSDLGNNVSPWYTDVTTGISVQIGGSLAERDEPPLSQIDRLWLNSSPVISCETLRTSDLRGELLTTVLDNIERIQRDFHPKGKMGPRERFENAKRAREKLTADLEERHGIQYHLHEGKYRFYRDEQGKGTIDVPARIFHFKEGFWLESLTALSIAENWPCETIHRGLTITHTDREERMGILRSMLKKPARGDYLSRIWTMCRDELLLPGEFADMTFFDREKFMFNEYSPHPSLLRKNRQINKKDYHYFQHEEGIGHFVDWIIDEWVNLPKRAREFLTSKSAIKREIDVLAETPSHCLFIECKLDPSSASKTPEENKAQIDSLVASAASRGVNFSILAHSKIMGESWRGGKFDFIVPWNRFREPDAMLKEVISTATPSDFFRGKRRVRDRFRDRGPKHDHQ